MSKDIERSTGSKRGGLSTPGASGSAPAPSPGVGIDRTRVSFEAPGYIYDRDIPTEFRKGAKKSAELALRAKQKSQPGALALYDENFAKVHNISPRSAREMAKIQKQVHASGARQLDKPRKSMGRIVQRRVGWQATPSLIVITTAERELTKGEDGKFRPTGEWLIENRKTYRNLDGNAQKRTGTVKDDSAAPQVVTAAAPGATPTSNVAQQAPSANPEAAEFPEGTFALSFLPASVRQSAFASVPKPTVFDGTSLQFASPVSGEVDRVEVNVIRMSEKHAVVIQGKQKPGSDDWEVSQATYRLGDPEVEQV